MDRLVYYRSPRMVVRYFLYCLLMFAMIAVNYYMALSGTLSRGLSLLVMIIAVVGTLFFGMCAIVFTKMVISNKIILQVDEVGIYDRTSYISLGQISWEDIKEINYKTLLDQEFIAIELVDDDKYLKRLNWFKRRLILANYGLGYPTAILSFSIIKVDPEWLLEELQKRKDYYGQK